MYKKYAQPLNSRQYLRTLKMMHTTMLIGMIVFTVVVVVMMTSTTIFGESADAIHNVMKFVAPLVAVATFLGSGVLFKQRIDSVRTSNTTLRFRLEQYRTASIMRWAMLEGGVMTSLVGLLLTKNYYYAIFIFLLLVFFFLYAPSSEKIKTQLELNSADQAALDDEYADLN